jgi:hypothetical protein
MNDFEQHRQFYRSVKEAATEGSNILKDYFTEDCEFTFYSLDEQSEQFVKQLHNICDQESLWFEKAVDFISNWELIAYQNRMSDQVLRNAVEGKMNTHLKNSLVLRSLGDMLQISSALESEIHEFLTSNEDIGHVELLHNFSEVSLKVKP